MSTLLIKKALLNIVKVNGRGLEALLPISSVQTMEISILERGTEVEV